MSALAFALITPGLAATQEPNETTSLDGQMGPTALSGEASDSDLPGVVRKLLEEMRIGHGASGRRSDRWDRRSDRWDPFSASDNSGPIPESQIGQTCYSADLETSRVYWATAKTEDAAAQEAVNVCNPGKSRTPQTHLCMSVTCIPSDDTRLPIGAVNIE